MREAQILRNKILSDVKIYKYIDFSDYKVFDNAGIQTMIFALEKTQPNSNYSFKYKKLNGGKILLDEVIRWFIKQFF